jgi:hypothetical protein
MVIYSDSNLGCDLLHGFDTGAVDIALVLASLNELFVLDLLLHQLFGLDKVVVFPVFLAVTARAGCVYTVYFGEDTTYITSTTFVYLS